MLKNLRKQHFRCMFGFFFFFFLVFCFGYHWNDPFGFFQSCNTVPALPLPTPCIFQYLSFICKGVMVKNNGICILFIVLTLSNKVHSCIQFSWSKPNGHKIFVGFFLLKKPATICADICSPFMLISASFAFKDAISNSPLCSKAGIHCAALGEPLGCR